MPLASVRANMGNGSYTLLSRLLLNQGVVSEQDIEEAQRRQETSREPLGQILMNLGVLNQRELDLATRAQVRLRGKSEKARAHLLVVDDETEVGAVVGDILAGAGYSVGVAQTVDEAIAALIASDTATPALIVLDLNMPGKGGLEILPIVQQLGGHPIPIIVLTGRADMEEQVRAQSPHVRGFLPKPTGARDLVRAVEAVLNESPVPAA